MIRFVIYVRSKLKSLLLKRNLLVDTFSLMASKHPYFLTSPLSSSFCFFFFFFLSAFVAFLSSYGFSSSMRPSRPTIEFLISLFSSSSSSSIYFLYSKPLSWKWSTSKSFIYRLIIVFLSLSKQDDTTMYLVGLFSVNSTPGVTMSSKRMF